MLYGHRVPRATPLVAALAALAVAGCGRPAASRNVSAFARQGATPTDRAILRSIGIYRTSRNLRHACSFATARFLRLQFDGSERECEYFSGQSARTLPRTAQVVRVAGKRASVRIRELTATRSNYEMLFEGGVWRIDAIVAPPGSP